MVRNITPQCGFNLKGVSPLSLRQHLVWLFKTNLSVLAINVLIFTFLILFGSSVVDLFFSRYFTKILFLEAGIVFVVAGAIPISDSVLQSKAKEYIRKSDEKWSIEKLNKSEKRANKYIVLAATLFVEALVISLLGA